MKDPAVFVSKDQAIEVANAFLGVHAGISGLRSSAVTQSNPQIETIKDQSNDPLIYVMNYPEGGWAIVSATRNFYPVLAFSDKNSFYISKP